MDYTYQGQPFVNVPANTGIDLGTLDYIYEAQPFAGNQESFFVSVAQTINITESYTVYLFFPAAVNDTIDITEYVEMLKDILDILPVSDSIDISENIEMFTDFYHLFVFDSVDVSENLEMFTDMYNLSVLDNIYILEQIFLPFIVDGEEVMNVSEYYSVDLLFGTMSFVEDLNLIETFFLYLDTNIPSTRSRLNISEYSYGRATLGDINVFDGVNTSEYIELLQYYPASAVDSIELSEAFTGHEISDIDLHDELVFEDIVTNIENTNLGGIDVFSTLNISENNSGNYPSAVSVYSGINISELLTVYFYLGDVNKFDSVLIRERVTVEIYFPISVADQVDLSEVVIFVNPANIFVWDNILLTEFVDIPIVNDTMVDRLSISESITIENFRFSPIPGRRLPVGKVGWDT